MIIVRTNGAVAGLLHRVRFARQILTLCGFILTATFASGIDVPFYIEFRTANELLHYPGRESRKINADDDYKISFGIDSLSLGEFRTRLTMLSTDNFIKEQVLIDHAELSYTRNRWSYGICSKTQGFGSRYRTNNGYFSDPQFDKPLYKSYRFNGFNVRFGTQKSSFDLSLGAMDFDSGVLGLSQNNALEANEVSLKTTIRTEFRIRDSFHSRPLGLYGLGLQLSSKRLSLKAEGVLAHYLRHNDEASMLKHFHIAELDYRPRIGTMLYLSKLYESKAVYPLNRNEYKAGFEQDLGRLSINPVYEYQKLDHDNLQRMSLLLGYKLHRDVSFAIYFRRTDIRDSESNNLYGIQARLRHTF